MGRPLQHRRRITIALVAALALDVGFAVLTTVPAGASGAASATASAAVAKKAAATASLHVEKPNVSVRRKGKTAFKAAKEGQKLRVGDTIKTDATGQAQINYTEGSFTRLDVNTTFTIISLTDDQGHRKVNGSLDSGRTWNRTTALTESESFQQQGGGATAAVVGSAFAVECTDSAHCTFISMVDGLKLTVEGGVVKLLNPLQQCDSNNAVLCTVPADLTADVLAANAWLLQNLFLDGVAGLPGIIVVQNGQVTSFTPSHPPANNTGGPPPNNTTPPAGPPAPTVDSTNPICIPNGPEVGGTCQNPSAGPNDQANPNITTDDLTAVSFLLNGSTPDGSAFYFVITALPHDPGLGSLTAHLGTGPPAAANTSTHYDPATTFTYTPLDSDTEASSSDSFKYQAVSAADSSKTSGDPTTVHITVNESGGDDTTSLATSSSAPAPAATSSTATSSNTPAP